MMFLLNLKALVEPRSSPYIGVLTFGKVRTLTAVMYSPLVASRWSPSLSVLFMYLIRDAPDTVLSIVFAALQEDYPAARFPALCWLLFFIPLFCVSILLYLSIRRAEGYSIIARLWLVLAVGHACGVLSATCALVGKGDFQAPTSLFDAFWITCVTFALHSALFRPPGLSLRLAYHPGVVHSIIPDPYLSPSPLLSGGHTSLRPGVFPRALVITPRPSNAGSVRFQQPAIVTPSAEDFRNLQDPFASPSSPLTEKPFPLFEAARIEQAKKKSVSILLATTRHSSPADLILPQKFLQSLEDNTPLPSPPASALVRGPRHASYSGALRA